MSHVEMGYEQVESRLSIIGAFTPLPVPKRYCKPTFIGDNFILQFTGDTLVHGELF